MIVIIIPVETEQPVLMVLMITRVHVCLASLDPIVKLVGHDYHISRLIENVDILFDCCLVFYSCTCVHGFTGQNCKTSRLLFQEPHYKWITT